MNTHDPTDCALLGASTRSQMRGTINDEMLECIACGHACRHDMTEHSFFGFAPGCEFRKPLKKD